MHPIPRQVVNLVTFPGVIFYQFLRLVFCKITGVKVVDVCYFNFKSMNGYVHYQVPKYFFQEVILIIGPFLINSIIAMLFAFASVFEPKYIPICKWLTISVAMNSFPNLYDGINLWKMAWERPSSIISKILSAPLFAIIYVMSLSTIMWVDLAYGILMIVVFQNIIVFN